MKSTAPLVAVVMGSKSDWETMKNASDATVTTLSWPVLGDLIPPKSTDSLYRENLDYGTMKRTPLSTRLANRPPATRKHGACHCAGTARTAAARSAPAQRARRGRGVKAR